MIKVFLHSYGYNVTEKVYLKDLCKTKQLPNQSFPNFVKLWKGTTSRITLDEHELKHVFVDSLSPQYKIFVISHHDLSLREMTNTITKKERHIKKLFTINSTQTT